MSGELTPQNYPRLVTRVHPDTRERVVYWAASHELSVNQYVTEAVEEKIKRENGDYDLPTLEINRLNELVELSQSMLAMVKNLIAQNQTTNQLLTKTMRGDNYLVDREEDGELDG